MGIIVLIQGPTKGSPREGGGQDDESKKRKDRESPKTKMGKSSVTWLRSKAKVPATLTRTDTTGHQDEEPNPPSD